MPMQRAVLAVYVGCLRIALGVNDVTEASIASAGRVQATHAKGGAGIGGRLEEDSVELMQRSLTPVLASQPLQPPAPEYEWTVYYDRWITNPNFGKEYTHGEGDHCLKACEKDPTCAGLAFRSDLKDQCYKYDQVPDGLGEGGQSLNSFLAENSSRKVAFSIFVKSERSESQGVNHSNYADNIAEKLGRIAQGPIVAGSEMAPEDCDWDVYYDTWLPTFKAGEYFQGAHRGHCLDLCCADPSCTGLAMDAWEAAQCYKYEEWPTDLDHSGGRRLGNGMWLRDQKETWTVFMKVDANTRAQQRRTTYAAAVALPALALAVFVLVRRGLSRDSRSKDDFLETRSFAAAIARK